MKALPSWNLKTIRQFLLTSIAQKPCRSPFNGWRRKPGKSISSIQVAVSNAVNRILSFRLCPGWIPETLPVSKNLRNPLWLNVLIIDLRLTLCCATRNSYFMNHYLMSFPSFPRRAWEREVLLLSKCKPENEGCPGCILHSSVYTFLLRAVWYRIEIRILRLKIRNCKLDNTPEPLRVF